MSGFESRKSQTAGQRLAGIGRLEAAVHIVSCKAERHVKSWVVHSGIGGINGCHLEIALTLCYVKMNETIQGCAAVLRTNVGFA